MKQRGGHDESFAFSRAGFAHIFIIIFILIIGIIIGWFVFGSDNELIQNLKREENVGQQQSEAEINIYKDDYVAVNFLWPAAHEFISNEESEVQILNTSNQPITIINPYLTISSSEIFKPASEGWESFASKLDHEYIEKIIIYNSIPESPMTLASGQFGKLHWHFLFNDEHTQSPTQTATIFLKIIYGAETFSISEELERQVKTTDHYESDAIHPVSDYFENGGSSGKHNQP